MSTKKDYESMTVVAIRGELVKRKLPVGGTKPALITRLQKDDASKGKSKKPVAKKPAPKPVPKKTVKKPVKKTPPKKKAAPKKTAPKKKPEPEEEEQEEEVSEEAEEEPEASEEAEEEEQASEDEAEEEQEDEEPEASEDEEAASEEEEEAEEEPSPPKPKPKKEVKKAATAAKPTKVVKTAKDEFDDVDIPEWTYTITAKNLADLIHAIFSKGTAKQPEKFQKLFSELRGYGVEVETEGEGEEPEPEPVKEANPAKIHTTFNNALGVYNSQENYVYDPFTSSVYAKIVDDKIVPLDESDLGLFKARFWHISIAGRGRFAFASQAEIKDLAAKSKGYAGKKESGPKTEKDEKEYINPVDKPLDSTPEKKPTPEKKVVKKAEPEPTPEPVIESEEELEEGGDDGETIELGDETEVATDITEVTEEDTVTQVEEEEKEMLVPHITIDEPTFAKFVKAQFGLPKDKQDDYVAISKTAGLSGAIGEQIMGQYFALADRYPRVLSEATLQARRPAPKPAPATTGLSGTGTALARTGIPAPVARPAGGHSLGGVVRAPTTAPGGAGARATAPQVQKRLLK